MRLATREALVFAFAMGLTGCLSFHPMPLAGEPEQATFAQVDDTRVHYIDESPSPDHVGDRGRTLVLVHGFGASVNEWRLLIPELTAAGYRVIAIDLRGHGWSTRPDGDYSIAGQTELILDLLDRLGVERFSIIGHSWGSAVSLSVVSRAPDRVENIVLYNGMFFQEHRPALFSWSRVPGLGEFIFGVIYPERRGDRLTWAFYDPERFVTEAVVEEVDAYLDRPGTNAATLAGIRAMDFSELETRYRRVEQPVLLIWGREDQLTPMEWGERLANELQDARILVVPLCGHLPMLEAPSATSNAILRFLEEQEVRG